MLRNVSKLTFFDKIGQTKSVGFRLYSAINFDEMRKLVQDISVSLRFL